MRLVRLPLAFSVALLAFAHPMGNFSVSHYTRVEVRPGGASLLYVLDLAEIPTFELLRQWGLDRTAPNPELDRKAEDQAREWAGKLIIRANGRAVTPRFERAELSVADGAGGLPVARIAAHLSLTVAPGTLDFEDPNYAGRAGWKEIVLTSERVSLTRASHGAVDRSQALTAYPQDPTVAPPQDVKASLEWTAAPVLSKAPVVAPAPPPTAPAAAPPATGPRPPEAAAPGTLTRNDFLSRLLRHRELTPWMMLVGLCAAFGLGSLHALSPGHGKTLVAAYLVGARGTARHAVFLGAMTTFTHTISVFALGFVTLFLSEYVAPETLNPILGAISGITIVWIGATLLIKRARKLAGPPHHHYDHDHGHDHDHHHGPGGHTHVPEAEVTMTSLIALGASGGLVPCPSALVLLLTSISLQRAGLGLMLLVAFSAGLACVLTGCGLLVLYAKNLLPDAQRTSRSAAFRWVPVLSAGVITAIGLVMTGVSLGWIKPDRLIG